MTPEQWQQVKELFEAVLECGPAERSVLLAQGCAGDEEVRREVESLLAAHANDSGFMNTPVGNLLVGDKPLLVAGQHFGPYEEISPIGEGGMGQVYLAVDTRLGRKVALKLLPSSYMGDPERVDRFRREARAASALNHPNIVTIHEIGQTDSLHFMATEFIDGETLREHMTIKRMTVGEVLEVATQIASALQAAHEEGIVHRDIKPENIMLRRDGFVKVLDFGLAKLAPQQALTSTPNGSMVNTHPGVVMGTVQYMSPEQARGAEVDARTDIWSLGVVLYEMVAGCAPFVGETPSHVIVSILETEPQPLERHAEMPGALKFIISRALSKNREERYQTAGDIALALKNLREELTVESRLKEFRRFDLDGKEMSPMGNRNQGLNTAHASSSNTAGFAMAHLTSTAQYLVNGIKRHKGSAVFASTTAFLLIAALVYFADYTRKGDEAINSVAVLHFIHQGDDPSTEYLSEGISHSIIKRLSRLPNLKVVSLNSALRYKGQQIDPKTVGEELNVRAVLAGRLTRHGDALAISAQLLDVRDNRQLWAEQYNTPVSDILGVQEKISGVIAERLRGRLSDQETKLLTKRYTENTEAYDAYARAHYLLEKRTGPTTEKSIEYFEHAIKLDPNYALAYAELGFAYWSIRKNRSPEDYLLKANEAVMKALQIDDQLAEAYTTLGHIRSSYWDWTGAENAFRRGVELNPNSAFAHTHYAFYFIAMRRFDEAVAESKRAVELEPTSVFYNRNVALSLYFARRYDEAIQQSLKTLELDPVMPTAHVWLGKSYQQKGLYPQAIDSYLKDTPFYKSLGVEAKATLKDTYAKFGWQDFWRKVIEFRLEQAKHESVDAYGLAETYAQLGDKDQLFAWLEKAYQLRYITINFLSVDPLWDFVRSDPRYVDLIRRMRLEQ